MDPRSGDADMERLEQETRANAIKQVAAFLQRPDQLERVEQLKKRYTRKKAAADAHLKNAVQSQLEGVKAGLSQLGTCLEDIKTVKRNLADVHSIYGSVSGLKDKLVDISKESAKHHQLASAVESLKHVANVPELVRQTGEFIDEGKLLHAHKHLADLEASRDQLLLELHKQMAKSDPDDNKHANDAKMLQGYFGEVQKLSEKLGKQLWLILARTLITVRKEPTIIVTALRIIERECRLDEDWKRRHEIYGFKPADRPKRWREKAINVLNDAIENKLEGCQLEDREQHKMWLVRHLEIIRRMTIEDLKVVKSLCEPCFPNVYDIVRTYVKLYHTAISQHLLNVIEQGLEGNEIVTLLNWITTYYSEELMGHRGLQIEEGDIGPLLSFDKLEELQQVYLNNLRKNITEYMSNSMSTDKKDWFREEEPESDGKGFYITQLPVLLFQIVDQNMQVAQIVGPDVTPKVLDLMLTEISNFCNIYTEELKKYKEMHLKDRSQPRFYIQYMTANVNNCDTLGDLTKQLKTKYTEDDGPRDMLYGNKDRDRYHTITNQFIQVADQGCLYLKEEVFEDLGSFINNILTRKWLDNENDVDTICYTIEDYHHDFLHLRRSHYERLLLMIHEQIIISYLRQLLSTSRKIIFNNPEEKRIAADKIVTESDQINRIFQQLASDLELPDETKNVLPAMAEILKMGDTSMMSLELSTLLSQYPDAKADQLVSLLQLRGDTTRSEAQQLVNDTLADRGNTPVRRGILSRVS